MNKLARERWFFIIVMPVDEYGHGPAKLKEAAKLTWEVWDQEVTSHSSHDYLADAIDDCERRNAEWEAIND